MSGAGDGNARDRAELVACHEVSAGAGRDVCNGRLRDAAGPRGDAGPAGSGPASDASATSDRVRPAPGADAVAGIGLRKAATEASVADALARAEAASGVTATLLATVARKADSPALIALARARRLRIVALPEAALPADTPTQSPRIRARFGTGSVAEAAALAAVPGAVLLTHRVVSRDGMATAAIAVGAGHPAARGIPTDGRPPIAAAPRRRGSALSDTAATPAKPSPTGDPA